MKNKFTHLNLDLFLPEFDSTITDTILGLEIFRISPLGGKVNPQLFFQLKEVFHYFESLSSARIEGNNTTLSEYINTKIEKPEAKYENINEINNMTEAMTFIEDNINDSNFIINRSFISQLHILVTKDLNREGSESPGEYRKTKVTIKKSNHVPPNPEKLIDYMEEFFEFINESRPNKVNLLIIAIAHHRFTWIHPFDNGNGRVVRLLTYTMLIRDGYDVKTGRILNPSAAFCIDRSKYFEMLALADSGGKENTLLWCNYVLTGLQDEFSKILKLLNKEYLIDKFFIPALKKSYEVKFISKEEHAILKHSLNNKFQEFESKDILKIFPDWSAVKRSRIIKKMRDKEILTVSHFNKQRYLINIIGNHLLREVLDCLDNEGFLNSAIKN